MSEPRKFYTAQDISRLSQRLGWYHATNAEAHDKHKDAVQEGALLRIAEAADVVRRFSRVLDAVVKEEVGSCLATAENLIHRTLSRELLALESRHGECPTALVEWFFQQGKRYLGRAIRWPTMTPVTLAWILPPKGSELRRSYNRWRKRKAKRSTVEQGDTDE